MLGRICLFPLNSPTAEPKTTFSCGQPGLRASGVAAGPQVVLPRPHPQRAKTPATTPGETAPPKHNPTLSLPQAIVELDMLKADLLATNSPDSSLLADRIPPITQALKELQDHQEHITQADELANKLQTICQKIAPTTVNPIPGQSWAAVAARGLPQLPATTPALPARTTRPDEDITIRPNQTNEKLRDAHSSKEILQILAPNLLRTTPIAARRLRSGDIRVTLKNKPYAIKNKGSIQHQIDATILQEVFPVEVLAVPLSLGVQKGPNADNTKLLQELSRENGKTVPNIQFTKIHWIRQRTYQAKNQPPKSYTSLILSPATAQHQQDLVRRGVLIEGQFYQARLYDYNQTLDRCFKCSKWGHTQFHCREPEPTCGHCCGQHWTKDCENTHLKACATCRSKSHKSWVGSQCPTFARLQQERQQLRLHTHLKSDAIRAATANQPLLPAAPTPIFETTQAGEKRRAATPAGEQEATRKAGPGRPRLTDPRNRPSTQSTLDFGTNPFSPIAQAFSQGTGPAGPERTQEDTTMDIIPQTQGDTLSSSASWADRTQDAINAGEL